MDLTNRIKKLEDTAGIRNPMPYCICNGDHPENEVFVQDTPEGEPMLDGKPYKKDEARTCGHCKKSIRRQVFIINVAPSIGGPPPGVATFNIKTTRD